ncbi:hypothetical protein ACCO45_007165 [Purpureocillium lilacinum]|uniref:Uncharacterized protein n=1 Tax=Purpureocillium lilacinum TaxID=33203 RepID=A0ACC4DUM3_PURLI
MAGALQVVPATGPTTVRAEEGGEVSEVGVRALAVSVEPRLGLSVSQASRQWLDVEVEPYWPCRVYLWHRIVTQNIAMYDQGCK